MKNLQNLLKRSIPAQSARSRLHPLAAALALTPLIAPALAFGAAVTHVVTTCDDPLVLPVCNGVDDGTARQAIGCALDGDSVDLSQLQCSTITLSAPLIAGPVGLTVFGPGPDKLTISAGGNFRVLVHNGRPGDTMYVSGVTLRNGRYENPYTYGGGGGCLFSSGNVFVSNTLVTSCYASATGTVATGGAIFAKGTATLIASVVSGSNVTGSANTKYASARGGGIYADTVHVYASTVSGNTAASPNDTAYGGGIYAKHVYAKYSTIAGNIATSRAGISATQSMVLLNSTISANKARDFDGGLHQVFGQARIYNSTIAFNSAGAADSTGGISGVDMFLSSTIVARNTGGGVAADVASIAGGIQGTNNLIMASNVPPPPDTIAGDPKLGPLQDNGGLTPTHVLLAGSPAIDHGGNLQGADYDQRFDARQAGTATDIGAVEFDRIFRDGFDPEVTQTIRD